MATYYALTTHGQRWFPLNVIASTRDEAERQARAIIGPVATPTGTDIERETEHKNLCIVPKSRLRRYGLSPEYIAFCFDQ